MLRSLYLDGNSLQVGTAPICIHMELQLVVLFLSTHVPVAIMGWNAWIGPGEYKSGRVQRGDVFHGARKKQATRAKEIDGVTGLCVHACMCVCVCVCVQVRVCVCVCVRACVWMVLL